MTEFSKNSEMQQSCETVVMRWFFKTKTMKLKAKHIAKLRKKAKLMQTYKVRESWSLFGFDTFNTHDFDEIKANSTRQAMQRFFERYYRIMKKLHRFHEANIETTYDWGRIEVIDEKGFKTYFK